jgi:hypothetical protein
MLLFFFFNFKIGLYNCSTAANHYYKNNYKINTTTKERTKKIIIPNIFEMAGRGFWSCDLGALDPFHSRAFRRVNLHVIFTLGHVVTVANEGLAAVGVVKMSVGMMVVVMAMARRVSVVVMVSVVVANGGDGLAAAMVTAGVVVVVVVVVLKIGVANHSVLVGCKQATHDNANYMEYTCTVV